MSEIFVNDTIFTNKNDKGEKMNKIIPKKLNIGDEIRVIAPSRSMCILSNEVIESAKRD